MHQTTLIQKVDNMDYCSNIVSLLEYDLRYITLCHTILAATTVVWWGGGGGGGMQVWLHSTTQKFSFKLISFN